MLNEFDMSHPISLIELKEMVQQAIEEYGEDRRIELFNYKGENILNPHLYLNKDAHLEFNK